MMFKDPHLSDQDLLLKADGELPARREAQVRRHLQDCWPCRKRMADFENTISDFVTAYQTALDPQVPSGDGCAANLKRRLAAAQSRPSHMSWSFSAWRTAACFVLLTLLLSAGAFWKWQQPTAVQEAGIIPNPNLTPGEATSASRTEVCQAQAPAETTKIPDALREAVFSAYGMKDAPRDAYEVDFLITPELGGAASIKNLWPEPYRHQAWNAHTKDILEDRLRSMVCSGELDLATAQHAIASDWVRAYRRYVGTDHPI